MGYGDMQNIYCSNIIIKKKNYSWILNIDPFTEFLRIAGSLYSPITAAHADNDTNDSDDNEVELSENETYI